MSVDACPWIEGQADAVVELVAGEVVWRCTPERIHVSTGMVDDQGTRALLEQRYRVVGPCPIGAPGVQHAERRP